jgi:PAS domain S-box-containing protein
MGVAEDVPVGRASANEKLEVAQHALRDSQTRLDAIIQSAMDAIVTVDDEQRVLMFNTAAERMFGCPFSGAVGSPVERFIPPCFRPAHSSHIRLFGETGTTRRALNTLGAIWGLRTDGEEFPLEAAISQVEVGGKKLYTVILRDISKRMRAEEALNASLITSEAALKDLADQKFALDQHSIVAVTDIRGTITDVNEKFCAISQYSKEELIGQNHRILNSGYHPREFFQEMYQAIASGKVWHGEIRNRAKSGSIYWVDTTIVPFMGPDQKPRQYVAIRTDITKRKLGEEAREQRLAAVVESSDDAIISKTLDGTITTWNPGAQKLFGYSPSEAIGKPLRMLLPPDRANEESDILERIGRGERLEHFESVRIRKDGSAVDVSMTISPIKDSTGAIIGASKIARDITEHKLTDQRLAAKAEELARSNQELEQFAYVASHDLQEPLRMVASYTQLLAERYQGKLDANADKFIRYANEGALRLQVLIHDLLAFSRLGSSGSTCEKVDCNAVMKEVLHSLGPAMLESGAVVNFAGLPVVWADPSQMTQVFQNLIGNAIKFRKPEPPVISVQAEKVGRNWQFTVRDNGIGIAPEYAENIFVVFQRLHARTEYPGNGIGLAICKKIVERYGGKIWVEAQLGRGSTFKFTLPFVTLNEPGRLQC